MSKRLLSALVALCMALTLMPSWAFAVEPAETPEAPAATAGESQNGQEDEDKEEIKVPGQEEPGQETPEDLGEETPELPDKETAGNPDKETPQEAGKEPSGESDPEPQFVEVDLDLDNEKLYNQFVSELLGLSDANIAPMEEGFSHDSALSKLTSAQEKAFYQILANKIVAIAMGESNQTTFRINATDKDPLTGTTVGRSAIALENASRILDAVRSDYPAYFYWSNRSSTGFSGYNGGGDYIEFTFTVDSLYAASGGGVDTSKISRAAGILQAAAEKAEELSSGKSDYEAMRAFKEYIESQVSYNYDAAAGGTANFGEDPWQIIYVFDNDSTTNVVCEGYAKAFQFLCDQAGITCYTVSGWMGHFVGVGSASNRGEAHMWNIVPLDGKNYLVDVTNCDESSRPGYQSVGYPDKLFLAGAQSVAEGGKAGYEVKENGSTIARYEYVYQWQDSRGETHTEDAADNYPQSILTLSSTKYTPPVELKGTVTISPSTVTPETTTLTASVKLTQGTAQSTAYQWLRDGTAISGAAGSSYTIADADRGHKLSVKATVTLTNNGGTGTLTSAEVSVPKLNPNAPDAPAATATYNAITVTSPNPAYEYACSTASEAPASGWKSGAAVSFTGLREGTTYYVFARVKATASADASDASAPAEVKTPFRPGAPALSQFTYPTLPATVPFTGLAQPVEVTSEIHDGHFTVLYNGSETAPVQVGRYTVTVRVEAHDTEAGSFTAATLTLGVLTISKANVRIEVTEDGDLSIGDALTLAPKLYLDADLDGVSLEINDVTFSFASSNRNVAAVSPAQGASCTVTAVRTGTADITIRYAGNTDFNAASCTFSVTVSELPKLGLAFTSPITSAAVGDTVRNIAVVTAPEGVAIPSLPVPAYSSSDESVATVAADGTVTALKVGTATITATVEGVEGLALGSTASYTLSVSGKSIDAPTVTVTGEFVYNGEAHEPVPTVTSSEPGFTEADYEVSYENNIDAGTAKVIVTPKGENFSWTDPAEAEFTIAKAPAPTVGADDAAIQEHWSYTDAREFSIAGLFGEGYELLTCTLGEVADANNVLDGAPSLSGTVLSYKLKGFDAKVEYTATVPVTVTFKNHEDLTLNLIVKLVDLPSAGNCDEPVLKLIRQADGTFIAEITSQDGAEYNFGDGWQESNRKAGYQGGDTVDFSIRKKAVHGESVSGPAAAGTPVIVGPGVTPPGGTFSGSQTVTLHAKPGSKIVYTTNGSEPTYSMSADETPVFDGNGTLCEPGASFTVSASTTVKAIVVVDPEGTPSVSGIHAFIFTKRSSSSGGSGSGGGTTVSGSGGSGATTPSKPAAKPTTTPGISSSSDVTTAKPSATVKDGVASVTVNGTTGKDLVDEAVKNDSSVVVVAPGISGSADQTDVSIGSSIVKDLADRTDADLRVEPPAADVTISGKGLSGLANKGGTLVVSTSAKGDAVDVSITAGGSKVDRVSGGVKVEIPANCTYGTVAMVTKADGTTELVRKSVANAGTVTVPLEGSATITLVDKSKSFGDVPAGNTFAGAVAFVSSREIMNGTGADTFNPSAPLTRAQLAKVLHNLENNPAASAAGFSDVAADAWCAEAVQWAASRGIVTGYADGSFRPNAYITREQLAVMLYRYAGSPAVGSSELRFSDADLVGGYARTAMAWATQNGVINGNGGMLNPKGQATRAQAAQMLFNFMNNVG